ncbi:hypothetical protein [Pseudonocardia sp. ICBG601]|uniref:hypothetical protein n=1 Tax=Pseudonocardia sp. ICBG601 TaxID=2846759 RepID=UPI001CF69C92|nr:hypothetical protein [Pseudonocardia sp. ICBG601]
METLTEQAAHAAAADPDAVALLETLTDPALNLDDLDTTSSSKSAESAGEAISRTSSSAAPAPATAAGPAAEAPPAAQEPDAAASASASAAPVAEKSAGGASEEVWAWPACSERLGLTD